MRDRVSSVNVAGKRIHLLGHGLPFLRGLGNVELTPCTAVGVDDLPASLGNAFQYVLTRDTRDLRAH